MRASSLLATCASALRGATASLKAPPLLDLPLELLRLSLPALLDKSAAVLERAPDARVLVHDMARPLVRLSDIQALLDHDDRGDGAILARPVTDTIKQADADTRIRATLDRAMIWRALTPQLFEARRLHDALLSALRDDPEAVTDEASALEAAGARPALVAGHADNIKITVPEDLALARFYLRAQEEEGLAWQFV